MTVALVNATNQPDHGVQAIGSTPAVGAGGLHSLVLKSDGTVWSFGYNYYGQLGTSTNNGTGTANPLPVQVMSDATAVAAGGLHSLVLKSDGTVWSFGNNFFGQLGTSTSVGQNANPLPVQVMSGATAVAAGSNHSLVLKSDGTVWSFGNNAYGQLGTSTNNGTESARNPPLPQISVARTGADRGAPPWVVHHGRTI